VTTVLEHHRQTDDILWHNCALRRIAQKKTYSLLQQIDTTVSMKINRVEKIREGKKNDRETEKK